MLCLGVAAALALRQLTHKPPASPPLTKALPAPTQFLATAPASSPTPSAPSSPSPSQGSYPAPAVQATLGPGEVDLWIHCLDRCRAGTIAFLGEGDAEVLSLDFQPGKSQRASLPAGSYTYQVRFEGETSTSLPQGQIPAEGLPAAQGSLLVDVTMERVTFWIFYPDVNILTNYK